MTPPGSPADTAGDVDEQGMICIDGYVHVLQLFLQALASDTIAQEEVLGIFIVNEVAHRVGIGVLAPLIDGSAVVIGIFNDRDAAAAEQVFLPLFGIGRHVDDDFEADFGTHDADAHAQIAGTADLDGVLAEEIAEFRFCQDSVVIGRLQFPGLDGQVFGMFQDFINAAAGFDRTRNGQVAVHLQEQLARNIGMIRVVEELFHPRRRPQFRFDDAVSRFQFREDRFQIRGETLQAVRRILDVCRRYGRNVPMSLVGLLGVEPERFFQMSGLGNGRNLIDISFKVLTHDE